MLCSVKTTFDRTARERRSFLKSLRQPAVTVVGLLAMMTASIQGAMAQGSNRLERIDTNVNASNQLEVRLQLSDTAPTPVTFAVDNPARISLDLPDTSVAMSSRRVDVKRAGVDTVNVAEAGGRTRVVLNLDSMLPYSTRVDGNNLFVTIGAAGSAPMAAAASSSSTAQPSRAASSSVTSGGPRTVRNVDFRRGQDGSGRIVVELSDSRVPADLKQEGGRVIVDFGKTSIPDAQLRRLDVLDFATPVNTVDAVRMGDNTRLIIAAHGDFDHVAYQVDNIYTIEIKPVVKPSGELADRKEYTGTKMSMTFQDLETRAALQLLAETGGVNLVINDTVQGNVTLRLEQVPWDQIFDIVLETKGLDKRQEGNVIRVGPAAEIAAREKAMAAARKELSEVAPLRTEFLQVNYAKASDLAALIKSGKGGSLLSARGNVSIDERTNTLLLQDNVDRLAEIRRLVSTIDIPIRQVLIEARIVVVSEDFSRDLGVRFGTSLAVDRGGSNGIGFLGAQGVGTSDSKITLSPYAGQATNVTGVITQPADSRYMVNLPIANPAGKIAMTLIDSDYIVDLELAAAQAEGRGEIQSTPRIIAANQKEVSIEQGVEIPYQESSSSGATTTQFKKAVLSLKVTPQITPDNKVIMDLTITKDSVGQLVSSATGGFVPSIDTRTISTQVVVNDGQTVVLGGVHESERRDSERKVPLLGDVPVLGHLFKSNSKVNNNSELLIFVTPKIIKEGATVR